MLIHYKCLQSQRTVFVLIVECTRRDTKYYAVSISIDKYLPLFHVRTTCEIVLYLFVKSIFLLYARLKRYLVTQILN